MARYWVKIDEAVEGPFEDKALPFVPGFKLETLVSPDREGAEDTWVRASDVEELKFVFAPPPAPEPVPPPPPPISIPTPPPPEPEPIPEPSPTPPPQILAAPVFPSEFKIPEPRIPKFEIPTPSLPAEPPPPEKIAAPADFGEVPPSPDKDILEIIEQFPEVMEKKEVPPPPPEPPAEPAIPTPPVLFQDEEFVLSVPTPSKKTLWILLAGVLAIGGLAWFLVLGPGKGMLDQILKRTPAAPPPAPAEIKKEAPVTLKPVPKPEVKKPAPPKPKPKEPISNPAPRKKPVRKPAPAQEENLPDLKHQKFILPGVPAPDYRRKN